VSAIGASAMGIVMIIVTFAASDPAEVGVPPAIAGIVPFIAPVIPLGLAWMTLSWTREIWLLGYERRAALRFAALTSLLVFVALELGPLGAVAASPPPAPPPSPMTSAPP
jgi:hypothetical protein